MYFTTVKWLTHILRHLAEAIRTGTAGTNLLLGIYIIISTEANGKLMFVKDFAERAEQS